MRELIKPLPTAEEIAEKYPADQKAVAQNRQLICDVLSGKDSRLLVLTGPCSASNADTLMRLSDSLARFQEDVRDKIVLGLRVYIQKPRTELGWAGPINQPNPMQPPDLEAGIHHCASMMSEASAQNPLADEMLFTHNGGYFAPYLSYTALGARSAEDGEHRQIASGEDMPIGVKNPRSGDIDDAVSGVITVQSGHDHAHYGQWVRSSGNPHAHVILRGGKHHTNYGPDSIYETAKLLEKKEVQNPAIVVDASHDNSRSGNGKNPLLQECVLQSIGLGKQREFEGYQYVRGLMMEHNMKRGKQPISDRMDPDLSITDPCSSDEDMMRMVSELAEKL